MKRQPDFNFIISISAFWMQWSLVPAYHVPRIGTFPRVQSPLGAKLISSFLIFTHVFLGTKMISNYPCSSISSSTKFVKGIILWE